MRTVWLPQRKVTAHLWIYIVKISTGIDLSEEDSNVQLSFFSELRFNSIR